MPLVGWLEISFSARARNSAAPSSAFPPLHATSFPIALASAKLLVDALRRRGRNIDREQLVATLETFYRVPTGLTPPVS